MRAYYLRQAASWAPCSFRHKGGRQHSGMSLRKAPHGNPRRSRGGNSRRNSQQASRACPRQNFRPSFRPRRMPPQARCGCFPGRVRAPVAAGGGEPYLRARRKLHRAMQERAAQQEESLIRSRQKYPHDLNRRTGLWGIGNTSVNNWSPFQDRLLDARIISFPMPRGTKADKRTDQMKALDRMRQQRR